MIVNKIVKKIETYIYFNTFRKSNNFDDIICFKKILLYHAPGKNMFLLVLAQGLIFSRSNMITANLISWMEKLDGESMIC